MNPRSFMPLIVGALIKKSEENYLCLSLLILFFFHQKFNASLAAIV